MTGTLPAAPAALARRGLSLHVVGGGLAGLAAALEAAGRGHQVTLHEATPGAGGRARALPEGGDNGTHALLGANPEALDFLERIGARDRWVEPEPGSLPVYDLDARRLHQVALSPAGWRDPARRPPGFTAAALLALLRAALPPRLLPGLAPGGSIAQAFRRHPGFLRGFVAPLTLAALNTTPEEAGTAWLGAVLRRLARPGASRLYIARDGLGSDLVQPALAALGRQGVRLRLGHRLRSLDCSGNRATALVFGDGSVPLDGQTRAILALPPWEAARLLPGLAVPALHAPILNLHYAHATGEQRAHGGPARPRFIGLLGGLAQWVLVRPGHVSVTISAAGTLLGESGGSLAPRVWAELRQAALAAGLPGPWPEAPPPSRLIREHRATPLHGLERHRPPRLQPRQNLALAGDWTDPDLPATLEAAIRSGRRAARAWD